MKILRLVQKHFAALDIGPSNHSAQKYPFNKRILFGFILLGYLIVSQFVYIFHVANGFKEYIECVCSILASITAFVSLPIIVYRETELFESINRMEKLIDTSKKSSNQYDSSLDK